MKMRTFSVVAGAIVANVWLLLINIPFILLDAFQPKWAMQYKIQDEKLVGIDLGYCIRYSNPNLSFGRFPNLLEN